VSDGSPRRGRRLPPHEAKALLEAVDASLERALAAVAPFAEDEGALEDVLTQLVEEDRAISRVVFLLWLLPEERRLGIAQRLAEDPIAARRVAFFHAMAGGGEGVEEQARYLAPGSAVVHLAEEPFVAILRAGLRDPSVDVRGAAARLAYATERGGRVLEELLDGVRDEAPGLASWSAAALGTARDEASLQVLRRIMAGDDEQRASFAVRALAARPDARRDFFAALVDARRSVRATAIWSLGMIARDLDAEELAEVRGIEARSPARGEPTIATALAYYGARHR
jgi:hypothetical protein